MPNRKPIVDTLAVKLLLYFLVNPDEELSSLDIRVKFAMSTNNLLQLLSGFLADGWLARRRAGHVVVWMAGPKLLQVLSAGPSRLCAGAK